MVLNGSDLVTIFFDVIMKKLQNRYIQNSHYVILAGKLLPSTSRGFFFSDFLFSTNKY